MTNTQTELEKQIDIITKLLSLSAKIGLLTGGGAIVSYLLINGHYPQGVSIGDGLLFLVAAFCFGIVCLYFSVSITAAGILLSPILIPAINSIAWARKKLDIKNSDPAFTLQKINFPSVFFGACGIATIYFLARRNFVEHMPLILLPVFQYIMYSAFAEQSNKIMSAQPQPRTSIVPVPQESETQFNLKKIRKNRVMLAGIILIVPIFMGGVTSDLLKVAMNLAKIRIENTTILVKTPYSNLLPSPKDSKVENFKAFEGATVIFRGVGNSTLIEMRSADTATRLEIPNDSIIIQRTAKINFGTKT
ncbi:hypothetical protein [Pseudomonas mandelii]|uniref:hypothetical protein n=1 Tax=Pseudomonas mandelii TaxID=75612 RepID=UPI0020A11EB9|nr:hypothetical protein [Pseudomonas mandelii]MCO8311743.1 hypothetical protein [Pseudomonas mandelii]